MLFSKLTVAAIAVLVTEALARGVNRHARRSATSSDMGEPTPKVGDPVSFTTSVGGTSDLASYVKTATGKDADIDSKSATGTHKALPQSAATESMDYETTTIMTSANSVGTSTAKSSSHHSATSTDDMWYDDGGASTTTNHMSPTSTSGAEVTETDDGGEWEDAAESGSMKHMGPAGASSVGPSGAGGGMWGDDPESTATNAMGYVITTTMEITVEATQGSTTITKTSTTTQTITHKEPAGSIVPPANLIDYAKFEAAFGAPNDAIIDCKAMPEGVNQGVSVDDLINFLRWPTPPANKVFVVDKSGCFQIMCVGEYGVLRLCNLKQKTGLVTFSVGEIKVFILSLLQTIRPNWEEEISINFDHLIYQPEALTFCGATMSKQPASRYPFLGAPNAMGDTNNKGPNSDFSATGGSRRQAIPEIRIPNYLGGSASPVARSSKFNGMMMNAKKGWGVVIDSAYKDDFKCVNDDNFLDTCRHEFTPDCEWDNGVQVPKFVFFQSPKDAPLSPRPVEKLSQKAPPSPGKPENKTDGQPSPKKRI
ncbi:hypothetical protein TWF281_006192 [Arthrobotrys megalospora]